MSHFKCNFCGVSKATSRLLNVHIRNAHTKDNNYLKCYFCDKSIPSFGLEPHIGWHTKELPYMCHFKCKAYNLKSSLTKHYLNYHPNYKFRSKPTALNCYFCGRNNKTPFYLENHLRAAHTLEKPFKCDFLKCARTFPTSGYKIHHVSYYCAQNPKRKQESQKKLTCYFCHAELSSRKDFCVHINGHTGEKPYKCSHCNLRFSHTKVRHRHILSKHKVHLHIKCNFCGVTKVTMGELNTHIRDRHTNDSKKFKCYFCDKEYANMVPKRHMLMDTNEFHHKCKYCPAEYRAPESLKYHYFKNHPQLVDVNKIQSKFNFSCEICGDKFYTLDLLLSHVREHKTSTKYFSINKCGSVQARKLIDRIYRNYKAENEIG